MFLSPNDAAAVEAFNLANSAMSFSELDATTEFPSPSSVETRTVEHAQRRVPEKRAATAKVEAIIGFDGKRSTIPV